jgi:predicted nucleotidyltransferase
MTTCVTLLNPIDEKREETLFKIATLAKSRGVPALLCGAFARDVLFWHMHGIHTQRETRDVDLSVQTPDWRTFNSLGQDLRQNGFANPDDDHPEKFKDKETQEEIDLLPFGEIAEDGRTLIWPQDSSRWSIVGLQESLRKSLHLEVKHRQQAQQLSLVCVPALVMLKIVAVSDRPEARYKKDATDIGFVITNYLEIGNRARLRTPPNDDILADADGDLDLATATLIGRDIAAVATSATRHHILGLLDAEAASRSRCHLARGLQKGLCKGDFGLARTMVVALADGVRWHRH